MRQFKIEHRQSGLPVHKFEVASITQAVTYFDNWIKSREFVLCRRLTTGERMFPLPCSAHAARAMCRVREDTLR
jgi:hypothetical protein